MLFCSGIAEESLQSSGVPCLADVVSVVVDWCHTQVLIISFLSFVGEAAAGTLILTEQTHRLEP